MKMDPEMSFQIRPAKNPTYIDRKSLSAQDQNHSQQHLTTEGVTRISSLTIKDHFFDTQERTRAKVAHRPKEISKCYELAKGVRGVREYHRVDESQLSMTSRMGISDDINGNLTTCENQLLVYFYSRS